MRVSEKPCLRRETKRKRQTSPNLSGNPIANAQDLPSERMEPLEKVTPQDHQPEIRDNAGTTP